MRVVVRGGDDDSSSGCGGPDGRVPAAAQVITRELSVRLRWSDCICPSIIHNVCTYIYTYYTILYGAKCVSIQIGSNTSTSRLTNWSTRLKM